MIPSPQRVAKRWLQAASVKIHGKHRPAITVLWKAFASFVLPNTTVAIHLHPRKSLGRSIGHVDSHDLNRGVAKVYFLGGDIGGIRYSLSNLGHELTHVLQYERGDLRFEGHDILWKGKFFMSGDDYKALSRTQHDAMPWEQEAIKQGKTRAAAFLANLESLKGQDTTLDYLIDNNLL